MIIENYPWLAVAFVTAALILGQTVSADAADEVVEAKDERIWELINPDAKIEKLAGDFRFTEGPVWTREGYLLFSDIPADTIYKWQDDEGLSVYRKPSGQSNGLTLDEDGRLICCEHQTRRVTRQISDETFEVLADSYDGKLLNSPNDAARFSDGSFYFTDPPYGIAAEAQELDYQGVFRLYPDNGRLELLLTDFDRPNGLAFSPDFKTLYIADSSNLRHIRSFRVTPKGRLYDGKLFAKLISDKEGVPDGLKVDHKGNVWSTGPMGIWIFAPDGTHLGTINTPEVPANCAWGDPDGKAMYITARSGLYRIRTLIGGELP